MATCPDKLLPNGHIVSFVTRCTTLADVYAFGFTKRLLLDFKCQSSIMNSHVNSLLMFYHFFAFFFMPLNL